MARQRLSPTLATLPQARTVNPPSPPTTPTSPPHHFPPLPLHQTLPKVQSPLPPTTTPVTLRPAKLTNLTQRQSQAALPLLLSAPNPSRRGTHVPHPHHLHHLPRDHLCGRSASRSSSEGPITMKSTSLRSRRRLINVLRRQNPLNGIPVTVRERQRAETRESHSPRRKEYVHIA